MVFPIVNTKPFCNAIFCTHKSCFQVLFLQQGSSAETYLPVQGSWGASCVCSKSTSLVTYVYISVFVFSSRNREYMQYRQTEEVLAVSTLPSKRDQSLLDSLPHTSSLRRITGVAHCQIFTYMCTCSYYVFYTNRWLQNNFPFFQLFCQKNRSFDGNIQSRIYNKTREFVFALKFWRLRKYNLFSNSLLFHHR